VIGAVSIRGLQLINIPSTLEELETMRMNLHDACFKGRERRNGT
jgi:hypothetical protein